MFWVRLIHRGLLFPWVRVEAQLGSLTRRCCNLLLPLLYCGLRRTYQAFADCSASGWQIAFRWLRTTRLAADALLVRSRLRQDGGHLYKSKFQLHAWSIRSALDNPVRRCALYRLCEPRRCGCNECMAPPLLMYLFAPVVTFERSGTSISLSWCRWFTVLASVVVTYQQLSR